MIESNGKTQFYDPNFLLVLGCTELPLLLTQSDFPNGPTLVDPNVALSERLLQYPVSTDEKENHLLLQAHGPGGDTGKRQSKQFELGSNLPVHVENNSRDPDIQGYGDPKHYAKWRKYNFHLVKAAWKQEMRVFRCFFVYPIKLSVFIYLLLNFRN